MVGNWEKSKKKKKSESLGDYHSAESSFFSTFS